MITSPDQSSDFPTVCNTNRDGDDTRPPTQRAAARRVDAPVVAPAAPGPHSCVASRATASAGDLAAAIVAPGGGASSPLRRQWPSFTADGWPAPASPPRALGRALASPRPSPARHGTRASCVASAVLRAPRECAPLVGARLASHAALFGARALPRPPQCTSRQRSKPKSLVRAIGRLRRGLRCRMRRPFLAAGRRGWG